MIQESIGALLCRAAVLLPIQTPGSNDRERFGNLIERHAAELYDSFYVKHTDFGGKTIAEIGAGPFAMRHYLTKKPAQYYAVNVFFDDAFERDVAAFVRDGKLSLVLAEADHIPLDSSSVDVVISENTFEHLADYPAAIAEMHRILRPGGILATQFSPLYYSPYGAHFHDITKLPWIHLLFSEPALKSIITKELERRDMGAIDYHWEQYRTLNRLFPRDFLAPFKAPAWELIATKTFPFSGSMGFLGPLKSLLTHGIRLVARKPAASGAHGR